MIKSNCSSIKYEQESTLEFKLYMLIILTIMIKIITIFISLLTKIINLTLIDHINTQKINQISSQKFRAEVYFFTWNWWISDQENCWYMNRNFLIIYFKSRSTLSYSHWARFLFHNWSNFYFICQFSRHVLLYVKKALTYCV